MDPSCKSPASEGTGSLASSQKIPTSEGTGSPASSSSQKNTAPECIGSSATPQKNTALEGTGSPASSRKNSTEDSLVLYMKSRKDSDGKLVESKDLDHGGGKNRRITMMPTEGFEAPITLAVPRRLLPPGAVPVIAGNTIELGVWDINTAEVMSPATGELKAPGYAFYSVTVCSDYTTVEETFIRFAIVIAPPEAERDRASGQEIHCWEGQMVRRVAEYTEKRGVAFLLFGRLEPMTSVADLATVSKTPPPLAPGWLTDSGQAMLQLRLQPPQLDDKDKQAARDLAKLPVEVQLAWDPPMRLTPNYRGPLALGGRGTPVPADSSQEARLRFPSAGDIRAEFLQHVRLSTAVSPLLQFRFGDGLAATARLPQQRLTAKPPPPEEETLTCDIRPVSTQADKQRRPSIGTIAVQIRRIRYCLKCSAENVRSIDRCGQFFGPPRDARPVLIVPMPTSGSLEKAYVELPIGIWANGRLTSFCRGGPSAVMAALTATAGSSGAALGLVVRLVRNPADPPEALEAAADALLSLVIAADCWTVLVAPSVQLGTLLCLKQLRLPVAVAFAAEADATGEALDVCRHYGVRGVVLPAAALRGGGEDSLLAAATSRGLAVYASGAASPGDFKPEVAGKLEGIFTKGTFAECQFQRADESISIPLPVALKDAAGSR